MCYDEGVFPWILGGYFPSDVSVVVYGMRKDHSEGSVGMGKTHANENSVV